MKIHLVDGTYELFRGFYGPPPKKAPDGREVGATLALLRSMLTLVSDEGATHVGVAFDHVVESFRNDLFPGYKTGAGIDPDLYAQFSLAEEALSALGLVIWPMVEFEADDAIATAVARFQNEPGIFELNKMMARVRRKFSTLRNTKPIIRPIPLERMEAGKDNTAPAYRKTTRVPVQEPAI